MNEDKKNILLQKYGKKKTIADLKKFIVFKRPLGSTAIFDFELIANCGTQEEAEAEISWRLEAMGNKDAALDNDGRLKTFKDDSDTGITIDHYKTVALDYEGEYIILNSYLIQR